MANAGPVTLSQVEEALTTLGGRAEWEQILKQVTKLRNGDYSYYLNKDNYEKTAFQVIQQHCPGYKKYVGPSRFEKVEETYRLLSAQPKFTHKPTSPPVIPPVIQLTPVASDIKEPLQPDRVKQETYRILRDTALARSVKEENQYRCQLCGLKLELNDKMPYAEAHHVKPLGAPHNGPDVRQNILCVCPNHHVLLDYGAIQIDESRLAKIEKEYIRYHNGKICKKVS